MAKTIANAYVQILPSAQGFKSNLSNAIKGDVATSGAESGASFGASMVSKLKAVVVAAGIGKVFKEAINEGSSLEQSLGGIETLFKDSSEKMKKYAKEAFNTVGLSSNAYMQQVTSFSASLLQDLEGDTSTAADVANRAMIDMADNANKMGTEMVSIQNAYQGFAKQNYTMLDNLKLGYGGTKTEMQRLVADASKMTDIQKELNVTVEEGSLGFGNIINAISVMQKSLGIAGTTSLEAAKTVTGSMAAMKASLQNVLGEIAIGGDFETPLNQLLETTRTFLENNFVPMVGRIFESLPAALPKVGEGLIDIGSMLFKNISGSADSMVKGAKDLIVSLTKGIKDNAPEVAKMAGELIQGLIDSIVKSAPEVLDAGIDLGLSLGEGLLESIPDLITDVVESLDEIIDAVVTDGLPKLIDGSIKLTTMLLEHSPEIIAAIIEAIPDIMMSISEGLINGVPQLVMGMQNVTNSLITELPGILAALGEEIPILVSGYIEACEPIVGEMKTFFSDAWGTVKEEAEPLRDWFVEHFGGVIEDIRGIWNQLSEIFSLSWEIIKTVFEPVKQWFADKFNEAKTAIKEKFSPVETDMKDVWTKVKNVFGDVKSKFSEVGRNIVSSIQEGVSSMWDSFVSSITGWFDGLIEALRAKLKALKDSVPGGDGDGNGDGNNGNNGDGSGGGGGGDNNTQSIESIDLDPLIESNEKLSTFNKVNNDLIDYMSEMLEKYLPEIATNKPVVNVNGNTDGLLDVVVNDAKTVTDRTGKNPLLLGG